MNFNKQAWQAYGKRRVSVFWWVKTTNQELVDTLDILSLTQKIQAYEKRFWVSRLWIRMWTPIAKERELLVYRQGCDLITSLTIPQTIETGQNNKLMWIQLQQMGERLSRFSVLKKPFYQLSSLIKELIEQPPVFEIPMTLDTEINVNIASDRERINEARVTQAEINISTQVLGQQITVVNKNSRKFRGANLFAPLRMPLATETLQLNKIMLDKLRSVSQRLSFFSLLEKPFLKLPQLAKQFFIPPVVIKAPEAPVVLDSVAAIEKYRQKEADDKKAIETCFNEVCKNYSQLDNKQKKLQFEPCFAPLKKLIHELQRRYHPDKSADKASELGFTSEKYAELVTQTFQLINPILKKFKELYQLYRDGNDDLSQIDIRLKALSIGVNDLHNGLVELAKMQAKMQKRIDMNVESTETLAKNTKTLIAEQQFIDTNIKCAQKQLDKTRSNGDVLDKSIDKLKTSQLEIATESHKINAKMNELNRQMDLLMASIQKQRVALPYTVPSMNETSSAPASLAKGF